MVQKSFIEEHPFIALTGALGTAYVALQMFKLLPQKVYEFRDDFSNYVEGSDGFPIWHVLNGEWMVINKRFEQQINASPPDLTRVYEAITPVPQVMQPYSYEFDMNIEPTTTPEIMSSLGGFGFFIKNNMEPGFYFNQYDIGWTLTDGTPNRLGGMNFGGDIDALEIGKSHHYRIIYNPITGETEIERDNELFANIPIPSTDYGGYIALTCANKASFDNIVVKKL